MADHSANPSALPAGAPLFSRPTSPRANAATGPRLGGHLLADALVGHGVDTIFGVPGESYLSVLDGLYRHRDVVNFIVCRNEGGASFMADAYAKLTGKPGILMVTRGPGATNGSIGVHSAHQDSSPLVVFVGQVGTDFLDREAFQEIDYRRMYGPLTKWVAQIDRADRIPEYLAHAFQVATSGRQGPVLLALPEDMLIASADVPDAPHYQAVMPAPSPAQIDMLRQRLSEARRPLVLLGGTGWTPAAAADLRTFVEANRLPVSCAFRFQDLYDNRLPNYVGDVGIGINPKLAQRVRESDLVLTIGARLGEMTTSGYTLFEVPVPKQFLIHVHPGIDELGRVYQAGLMINAGMAQIAQALRDVRVDSKAWAGELTLARADYESWQARPPISRELTLAVDPWQIVQTLRDKVPADTLITNGAGNFATWAHRFWPYAGQRTQLAPTSGAMGAGVPSAVAAKIVAPNRTVVCFAGDGDFLMTGQELATAAQYEAGIIILLFNNSMYGTIRMHQEREYPLRTFGTALSNPNFAKYCEAFGGWGQQVGKTADFGPALDQALAFTREKKRPALIELAIDPQAITPNLSMAQIQQAALKRTG